MKPYPVEAVPVKASIFAEYNFLRDREGIAGAQEHERKHPTGEHSQQKRLIRVQSHRRTRSLERKAGGLSRRSKRAKRFWEKPRSPPRFPTRQEQEAQTYPNLCLIANEMELNDFCRRLGLSDPTLTQVRIDGDLARSKAKEMNEAMASSLDDWCLKPVWDRSTGRTEKPSYVMFRRGMQKGACP